MGVSKKFVNNHVAILSKFIISEFDNGTRCFDCSGTELLSLAEVIECLKREGGVTMEPIPERQHIFRKLSCGGVGRA